jgi:hypothetical protein
MRDPLRENHFVPNGFLSNILALPFIVHSLKVPPSRAQTVLALRGKGVPMLAEPAPQTKSPFKNPLLYSSAAFLIVLLYLGWTFYSRWQDNRGIERRAVEHQSAVQQEQDRTTVEQMGGKDLAIQNFYGSPGVVRRGESAQLCYGVANAKVVKLEPQDNPVWPSYSRCVDVKPAKTTTYTLTAEDAAGHSVTQTVEIKVK